MPQNIKGQLVALVRDRVRFGQGAFQRRLAQQRILPGRMTNEELCRELEQAYGEELLELLDNADVRKFYESDLAAALGMERARIVLKHRRRPEPQPPTSAQRRDTKRPKRKVGAWTSGAIGIGMFLMVRAFTSGGEEGFAATPERPESPSSASVVKSDYKPYEFGSCAQYLGAVSGLRCVQQVGGSRAPAESPVAEVARQEIAQSIRASRWRRHGQCNLFLNQVDSMSFHAGSVAFVELRDANKLTQERVYDACSRAANRAAFEACSSASGMCEAD